MYKANQKLLFSFLIIFFTLFYTLPSLAGSSSFVYETRRGISWHLFADERISYKIIQPHPRSPISIIILHYQVAQVEFKSLLDTLIFVLFIVVSLLAFLNFRNYRKKIRALQLLRKKNQQVMAQKNEFQAILNMVEKLNSKLHAQNQALNKSSFVVILTSDGRIDNINEKFVSETGYKLSELDQKDYGKVLSPEHTRLLQTEILPAVKRDEIWRGRLAQLKKDGGTIWLDAVFVKLHDEDAENFKIYSVQFDITGHVQIEHRLIEKNKRLEHLNQLKSKMFSIVSHDFRSPLKSLAGVLSLCKKGMISPEEMKNLSTSLLEKVENTSNFLDNLLNWSKSQMKGLKIKPQVIDIHEVSRNLVRLLEPQAEKKNIEIVNKIPENLKVTADLEMVKLVLRNLISNALKFSYGGNKIILEGGQTNGKAIISIQDFGTGIEEEQLKNIFQLKNYSTAGTANEIGAGLGLILCKEFVEQNLGEIWATSKKNEGSVFSFSLPLVRNKKKQENLSQT